MIKIVALGTGLAVILGAGAILLSALGNSNWNTFLSMAILVFILGLVAKLGIRI